MFLVLKWEHWLVELKPTNIVKLIQSVIDEQKPQIDEKKINFSIFHLEDNIPLMQADPKLLRMVMQNLLSNAIKYTPDKGRVEVSLFLDNKRNVYIKNI